MTWLQPAMCVYCEAIEQLFQKCKVKLSLCIMSRMTGSITLHKPLIPGSRGQTEKAKLTAECKAKEEFPRLHTSYRISQWVHNTPLSFGTYFLESLMERPEWRGAWDHLYTAWAFMHIHYQTAKLTRQYKIILWTIGTILTSYANHYYVKLPVKQSSETFLR